MSTLQLVFLALAGGLIVFWVLFALASGRRPEPGARHVLHYGPVLRTFSLVLALAFPMLIGWAVVQFPWSSARMLAIAGASFLTTSLIGALPLIETARVRIILTDEGITRRSPWRKTVTLRWCDVERVRYSKVNQWFVLTGKGAAIRVSSHLVGIQEFKEMVQKKVPAERGKPPA